MSANINISLFKILNNYFFLKSKTSSDGTLLGRTSEEVLVRSSSCSWCSSFCCHLSIFFIHISLFDIISHPSVDYRQVFTPILYFQPSPWQSDSRQFHFQPFRYLLTASATVLSGRFFIHRRFLPYAPSPTFMTQPACVYQGFPGSWQFFLEICRASYWFLEPCRIWTLSTMSLESWKYFGLSVWPQSLMIGNELKS